MKRIYIITGMCAVALLWVQPLPAEKVLVRKRIESRLEENQQIIKMDYLRPGLHCMLLGRGASPLRMQPNAAVQWKSAGIGPVILSGIVQEIGKPFEYSLSSAVFQQVVGGRIDFSLHPRNNFGGILQWSGGAAHTGAFIETTDSLLRAGAWIQLACGDSVLITPCVFESLLPELSDADIDAQPLQNRYPVPNERRSSSTFAVELQWEERGCKCSLLTALMSSPAAPPSLFGRGYLQFGGRLAESGRAESLVWEYFLLGRWIGDHFTTAEGELPEERASLAAMLRAAYGRNELYLKGVLTRDKQPPVPDRYLACNRELSAELRWAVAWVHCSAAAAHSWAFDEEGRLSGHYEYGAEIGLKRNVWKAAACTSWKIPHASSVEYRHKFTCEAEIREWRFRGAVTLKEQLSAWEGYLRGEYQRRELCLWIKLALAQRRGSPVEMPLSLGMKVEYSEVQ